MSTFFHLCPSLSLISSSIISLLSILFILLIVKLCAMKNENKSKSPPEAGGAWPIIGHLHLLASATLPHKFLAEMADKHGPIFCIRNGVQKALVVSSSEMAKECFLLNDKAITSRPMIIAVDIMGYGDTNFVFSPSGPYWRSVRKIITLNLLSNNRLDMLSHVWKEEANFCINKLYAFWLKNKRSGSEAVLGDLKPWFSQLSMSIIVRIILGRNLGGEEISILHNTMTDFFSKIGSFLIGDALPFLRCLDLGGQEKEMRKVAKEMDDILESLLQEHKERRKLGIGEGSKDFMDVLLSILGDSHVVNDTRFDVDTINKATCLMLLVGASDTSLVLLTWAISLLLNNRDVIKKAQDELNTHVGKDSQVNESDIPKLVYIQAILKETLRMYPPVPLNGTREFNKDCNVGGYHVKKGTRLIVNTSKIHSDPCVWEYPTEFRPERFLSTHKDVDVRGQCFELIPFGSGRRICPGMSFGLRNTHYLLASFLQAFEFSTLHNAPVDMTESSGLTNLKKTPLGVLINPRLRDDLYI